MQNISIVGKFLTVFAIFGVFALGVAGYSASQMETIDAAYSDLIDQDNAAGLAVLQANRSLQIGRAAMADLMIAFTDEGNAKAAAEVKATRTEFVNQMDKAISLAPSNADLTPLEK